MNLLLLQLAVSWFLCGLICFVHVVHYPLFDGIGETEFPAWHARHVTLTGFVVVVPMLIQLGAAIALAAKSPQGMRALAFAGLALVAVAWLATFLGAVPAHNRLSTGFDAMAHRNLLAADLIRTIAWTAQAVLATWMLKKSISSQFPVPSP